MMKNYYFDLRSFYYDEDNNVMVHKVTKDNETFIYHAPSRRADARLLFTDNPTHENYIKAKFRLATTWQVGSGALD